MSAFNWSAIAFILAAIGLVVFMLVVPRLLGGRSQGSQKEEVFEAGVVGAGNARIRLSAKFYLVAIFFVIFDLEALYLYAYAVSVREAGCWLRRCRDIHYHLDYRLGIRAQSGCDELGTIGQASQATTSICSSGRF